VSILVDVDRLLLASTNVNTNSHKVDPNKFPACDLTFGNMTVELNIFNINSQPLEYDEYRLMCFIEEITDDFDFEDPEIECFTQDTDDLDLDKLVRPDLHKPSLEYPDIECFAPSRGHFDLSEPL
jgi:hypothetical protein